MSDQSTQQPNDKDVALSEVMLAMDVVDMLRHEDKLVARAMNAEAREQALIARVKKAYAAQGIDVTDELIANGVAALKEQEYAYTPAPPGFKTRLLTAWVNRRRIGGGIGVMAAFGALIAGGWYGFVEYPEQRQRAALVEALDNERLARQAEIDLQSERLTRLQRRWERTAKQRPDGDMASAFDQLGNTASSSLATAERQLEAAATISPGVGISPDNVATREAMTREKLTLQQRYLDAARRALDASENAMNNLERLDELPAMLALLRSEAIELARPEDIDVAIERDYAAATAALRRGEFDSASAIADKLRALIDRLDSAYRVQIVSRPGEPSGVIREPPNNPRASNYYLIVEALDSSNRPVQVAIESEEDGSVATVSRWGVRVGERVFDRVRRDKQDDGIIQAKDAGEKRRGYVEIDYSLPVSGGMIHRWEAPR